MAANLIKLNEILDGIDFMDNEAQYGHHLTKSKKRYLGLKALRELNLDVAKSVKGRKIKLRANGSIELPDDYMDYVGIFVLGDRNELFPLGKNKFINISNEPILDHNYIPILDHNGELIYDSRDNTSSWSSDLVHSDSYSSRREMFNRRLGLYGIGGGRNVNGYYRVDIENNTIQFDVPEETEYIYLEYLSNGLEGVYADRIAVPVQVAEAIEAWIMWKSAVYQRGISAVEKEQLRKNFYNEKRKARARMSKFISEEARQASRVWTQQTPKY